MAASRVFAALLALAAAAACARACSCPELSVRQRWCELEKHGVDTAVVALLGAVEAVPARTDARNLAPLNGRTTTLKQVFRGAGLKTGDKLVLQLDAPQCPLVEPLQAGQVVFAYKRVAGHALVDRCSVVYNPSADELKFLAAPDCRQVPSAPPSPPPAGSRPVEVYGEKLPYLEQDQGCPVGHTCCESQLLERRLFVCPYADAVCCRAGFKNAHIGGEPRNKNIVDFCCERGYQCRVDRQWRPHCVHAEGGQRLDLPPDAYLDPFVAGDEALA